MDICVSVCIGQRRTKVKVWSKQTALSQSPRVWLFWCRTSRRRPRSSAPPQPACGRPTRVCMHVCTVFFTENILLPYLVFNSNTANEAWFEQSDMTKTSFLTWPQPATVHRASPHPISAGCELLQKLSASTFCLSIRLWCSHLFCAPASLIKDTKTSPSCKWQHFWQINSNQGHLWPCFRKLNWTKLTHLDYWPSVLYSFSSRSKRFHLFELFLQPQEANNAFKENKKILTLRNG